MDFHIYVQKLEACFKRWRADASDLPSPDFTGLFDGEFQLESELKPAVFQFAAQHPKVKLALETIMRDMLIVIRSAR